jgi:hypothetical protein
VPLDFTLYRSVSPEEMDALQRVVAAARELDRIPVNDSAGQTDAHDRNGAESRENARHELSRSLAALHAARTRRKDGEAGGLAPWLHGYLHRPNGRMSAWRPGEPEPRPARYGSTRPRRIA